MRFLRVSSCVYSKIMLTLISFVQKLMKRKVGIKAGGGGLENFSKFISGGGRFFGTQENGISSLNIIIYEK